VQIKARGGVQDIKVVREKHLHLHRKVGIMGG
jgi:hypothetical protein